MLLLWAGATGCDSATDPQQSEQAEPVSWVSEEERAAGPPHARWDMVAQLREDRAAERHPSDGAGRAWLEEVDGQPPTATAGRAGSWAVIYEAGPLGIAEGGVIGLQVSPFWGWSTPQTRAPEGLGYTTVEPFDEAAGLLLTAATWGDGLLGIEIGGRDLQPGERLRIHYGAGTAGARADRYAEGASRLWITIDGDGDGVRGLLDDSPTIRVLPGPPAGLMLSLPGTLVPGERGLLTIAAVDGEGNAGVELSGTVELEVLPPGLEIERRAQMGPDDQGRVQLSFAAPEEGLYRVRARGPGGLMGQSNPLLVSDKVPRIHFGDLHGHSALSDGTGEPEDYFRYAREVAGLDFAALTDHDHWGMRFLDERPDLVDRIMEAGRSHHEPGEFVTIHGYEWTSWIHGHRHVLFFEDGLEVFSSLDPRTEHPRDLWEALRGRAVITVPHHSAGGPIPTDWSIPPDPELEPLVEVTSVHGVSEAPDAPGSIYSAVEGAFARDALDRGYRLGFMGGGDSHDGHPGLAWLSSNQGGLVAVLDAELSRAGLLEALRNRRCYATNGSRTLLFTTLDGQPMGSVLEPSSTRSLVLFAVGDAPLAAVDIVRSGRITQQVEGADQLLVQATVDLQDLQAGEYVYVRVRQRNGGLAISSPFFVSGEAATLQSPSGRTE